ncbi:ankyrin repeat domain-containing protein [Stenotrophomonas sp. NPDC047960]|uniref:ankyrin repeat domain-containing protein n=1 Tax=Stenotrophomonas sp. NPDC047960 TaxID=3364531 RepID=UPI0037138E2D
MATSSSPVVLDTSLTCEDAFAEIERHVRAGVHPDRIRLRHNERALYWVCNNSLLHHDGPDEATIARRIDAHLALISLLLAAGADPNKAAGRGATPLSITCRDLIFSPAAWALEKLRRLLAAGANPRLTKDSPICTVLGLRDMRGEVWNSAFDADADPAEMGCIFDAIDALLQAGASIEAMDHRQMYTPVLIGAYLGSAPLLRFLAERGANVHVVNPAGSTALMYAAGDVDGLKASRGGISTTWHRMGEPVAVARLLIEWGLDPAAANERGRTPLTLALNAGSVDVAAVVAEALADQGRLLKADVRRFKGTEFEAHVAALATSSRTSKPPRRQAKPKGAAQGASWDRARQEMNHPDAWQRPAWFCAYNKALFEHLASGSHPVNPVNLLYADYTDALRTLRLSKTKDWISRSGVVTVQPDIVTWGSLRVSYAQLDGDDLVCREEIVMPMSPEQQPGIEAVAEAVGGMTSRYFKLSA